MKRDIERILYILRREIDILKKKSALKPFVEVLREVLLFGQACPLYLRILLRENLVYLKKGNRYFGEKNSPQPFN